MRIKYLLILAIAGVSCLTLKAQTVPDAESENKSIETGTTKALSLEESTAAISIISSEDIERRVSKNIGNSLIGQGLGLISLQRGGLFSVNEPTFYVRGLQSSSGSTPLILVDGIERDITNVAAEEVEKVFILKDAAATALYGYKGINGAIQIVTKQGEYNASKVRFTYDHMFNSLVNKPAFVDGYTYALAVNEARGYEGLTPRYNTKEIDAFRNNTYPFLYPNVNWVEETFRDIASTDNFNVEFSGGQNRFRYFVMMDLISDKGFIRNSEVNNGYSTQDKYSKGNLRVNLDVDMTPTTKLKVNVLGMLAENNRPGGNVSIWDMVYSVPSAAFPVRASDGRWAGSTTWAGTSNPLGQTEGAAYYKFHHRLLFADFTLMQDLSSWTEGLGAYVRVGYDNYSRIYENHSKTYMYTIETPTWPESASGPSVSTRNQGTDSAMNGGSGCDDFYRRAHTEAALTYDRIFGDHSISSQLRWDYDFTDAEGSNQTYYRQNVSFWSHYGFKNRYFVDLALVESGSSCLAPGTKWNFSPTISAAWLISEEDFFNSDSVNLLKLRSSVGLLKTDVLPGGDWTYFSSNYTTSGTKYPFQSNFDSDLTTTLLGRLATENPGVEKALKLNIGLDGRFWNTLDFSADAYWQRRSGIWMGTSGKYTSLVGLDLPNENAGIVDSWGFEFGFGNTTAFGDFKLNYGGNIDFNRSKIVEMLEAPKLYPNLVHTGDPLGSVYGYKAIGFFKDQSDINNSPRQLFTTVLPGDIKYEDVNGDGVIDSNDEVRIGTNNSMPNIYYNFHLGFEWKGLGFYALFQGAAQYCGILDTKSMYRPLVGNASLSEYYYNNRWTPNNQDAKFPRLSSESNSNNYRNNTVFLADRSFLKLRNLDFYYNLPSRWMDSLRFLDEAKVYVRGNDLFSFDHFEVNDPEAYGTGPLIRSIVVGLKLTF